MTCYSLISSYQFLIFSMPYGLQYKTHTICANITILCLNSIKQLECNDYLLDAKVYIYPYLFVISNYVILRWTLYIIRKDVHTTQVDKNRNNWLVFNICFYVSALTDCLPITIFIVEESLYSSKYWTAGPATEVMFLKSVKMKRKLQSLY